MPSSKKLAIPVQLLLFCISTALGSGPMGGETSGLSSDESSGMIVVEVSGGSGMYSPGYSTGYSGGYSTGGLSIGYNRPLAGVTGGSPGDTAVSEILKQINVLEQDLNNNYIAYTQGRMTQDQFGKYCNDLYSKIRNINIALHSLSETLANDAGLVGEAFEGSNWLEGERGKVEPPVVIPETPESQPGPYPPPAAQSGI